MFPYAQKPRSLLFTVPRLLIFLTRNGMMLCVPKCLSARVIGSDCRWSCTYPNLLGLQARRRKPTTQNEARDYLVENLITVITVCFARASSHNHLAQPQNRKKPGRRRLKQIQRPISENCGYPPSRLSIVYPKPHHIHNQILPHNPSKARITMKKKEGNQSLSDAIDSHSPIGAEAFNPREE